ncbi:hypothetical protein TNCV_3977181 [Trichonephila clavipes]|nr:hypothetical protein TNCV_3977181 [Trichonephila clavipes]
MGHMWPPGRGWDTPDLNSRETMQVLSRPLKATLTGFAMMDSVGLDLALPIRGCITSALYGTEDDVVWRKGDVSTNSEVGCDNGSDESSSKHDTDS